MKTKSLKITPAEKKRREKEMKSSIGPGDDAEYPWGFRITLNDELLKKFPEFSDAQGGDTFDFRGKCRVKEVQVTDRDKSPKNQRVEIQITDIGFKGNEDDLDDAFDTDD